MLLCILFMVGEAIGGALSNSLALFTDVLHLWSDFISFIISLFAIHLSSRSPTTAMSFGFYRAEVLGALFSVFLIWLISGELCYMAVGRIISKSYKNVKADEMLITASLGVVFNVIMGFVLHSEKCCSLGHAATHSHGGGHGHSHGASEKTEFDTPEDDHHVKSINVRAAFIHVVGDIVQSLGVLLAAVIIKFTKDERFRLADPICTFLFSLLVLITTTAILRDALRVMMEGVPRELSYDAIKTDLESIYGVQMVHSLYVWSLTTEKNAIAVHLAVSEDAHYPSVVETATMKMRTTHKLQFITIQVEPYNQDIMATCIECQAAQQT